jgi:hypothetical protein
VETVEREINLVVAELEIVVVVVETVADEMVQEGTNKFSNI